MSKRNIFTCAVYISFFLFIVFFVLFLVDKISLVFVLGILELFLILITVSCYLMLQSFKEDDYVIIYKNKIIFLIIVDFIVLLAIIGTVSK